jgi:hypothetical protein
VGALIEKALLSSGKIAWVVYILAKMKAGAKKRVINAHTVDWLPRVVCKMAVSGIVDKNIILM